MYKYILFDLDGTLTDSKEGVCKSVQHALARLNKYVPPIDELNMFIGPPLSYSFREFSHLSPEEVVQAIAFYRERYSDVGKYENKPYEGIPEMLIKLKKAGRILAVASSKPEAYVRDILAHFGMEESFDYIIGADMEGKRSEKEDVLREALSQLKIDDSNRKEAVMVGDRHYDINGAHAFNLDSVGVLFGYAPEGELVEAGATKVVETVKELEEYLLEE